MGVSSCSRVANCCCCWEGALRAGPSVSDAWPESIGARDLSFMRAQRLPLFDGYLNLLVFTEDNRLRQASLREEAIMLQPLKMSER